MPGTGGKLGLIAGGGALPLEILRACAIAERPVFVVRLKGMADPALAEAYVAECRRLGKGDGILLWPTGPMWVFVTEDPERSWAELGPHALHEANGYGRWAAAVPGASPFRPATSVAELRDSAQFAVVTPEECVDLARTLDPRSALQLKPLVGGLDPDLGWRSLELFVDRVLPALDAPPPGP